MPGRCVARAAIPAVEEANARQTRCCPQARPAIRTVTRAALEAWSAANRKTLPAFEPHDAVIQVGGWVGPRAGGGESRGAGTGAREGVKGAGEKGDCVGSRGKELGGQHREAGKGRIDG